MQLRSNAAAGQPQIGQRDARQQRARRLDEGFERLTAAFIIIFPVLESHGRPNPHAAAGGRRQVNAQAVT